MFRPSNPAFQPGDSEYDTRLLKLMAGLAAAQDEFLRAWVDLGEDRAIVEKFMLPIKPGKRMNGHSQLRARALAVRA
jgi:hypothetical protein